MASAASIKAGSAYVSIFLDRSGLDAGFKAAERQMLGFGNGISKIGAITLGSGTAIAASFLPAITAAATFEDRLSKFQTVFGDNAKSVRGFAKEFSKEVGRSESDILAILSESQDLLVPIGVDEATAIQVSKTLAKLTVDLASFNNLREEDVFQSLLGGLSGETENLKKFGVAAGDAAVKARALQDGLDPKNLSPAQRALTIFAITLDATRAAQDDAIRTSQSFNNRLRTLQSQLTDVGIAIGTSLLPPLGAIIEPLARATERFAQFASVNPQLTQGILALGAGLVGLGAAGLALGTIVSGLGTLIGLLSSPVLLASGALALPLLAALADIDTASEQAKSAIGDIRALFGGLGDAITSNNFDAAGDLLVASFDLLWQRLIASTAGGAASVGVEIKRFFLSVGDAFSGGDSARQVNDIFGIREQLSLDVAQAKRQRDKLLAEIEKTKRAASQAQDEPIVREGSVLLNSDADLARIEAERNAQASRAFLAREEQIRREAERRRAVAQDNFSGTTFFTDSIALRDLQTELQATEQQVNALKASLSSASEESKAGLEAELAHTEALRDRISEQVATDTGLVAEQKLNLELSGFSTVEGQIERINELVAQLDKISLTQVLDKSSANNLAADQKALADRLAQLKDFQRQFDPSVQLNERLEQIRKLPLGLESDQATRSAISDFVGALKIENLGEFAKAMDALERANLPGPERALAERQLDDRFADLLDPAKQGQADLRDVDLRIREELGRFEIRSAFSSAQAARMPSFLGSDDALTKLARERNDILEDIRDQWKKIGVV